MKNLTPKLKNILVTSVIAVVALVVAITSSINFVKHTNFEVKYAIREDLFEIQHISDYSPSIKGTEGDAAIYKNFGTKNSVLLTKKSYSDVASINAANLCIDSERFDYEAFENGQAMLLDNVNSFTKVSTSEGATLVSNNQYDGFICSYENAKDLVSTHQDLFISPVEIELFPKILVLGGTHPYEANGFVTATMLLENIETERGIFFIINETNKAGFNYEQEGEARQQTFDIPLVDMEGKSIGSRTFKIGSRFAHITSQWPTSDMYMHSSGQQMTNTEARNLNRVYPGSANGNFTERVAYGVTELVRQNNITMVCDLHEASPEYLTNNAIVYHNDAADLVTYMWRHGLRYYDEDRAKDIRIDIKTEESTQNMRGLTHRDLGDYSNAYVILCESSDAYEGRLHGALTADLITYYDHNDKFYEYITNLSDAERSRYVDYWFSPDSIDVRCARHTLAIYSFIDAYNNCGTTQRTEYSYYLGEEDAKHDDSGMNYTGKLIVNNIPSYNDLVAHSVGAYLKVVD